MDDGQDHSRWEDLDDETKQQARERAEEIRKMYEPGARPTETVPGTDGMISGTAFAEGVGEHEDREPGADARDDGPGTAGGRSLG